MSDTTSGEQPVVCVKSNGPTWKWIVTTLLGLGVLGAGGYASMRVNHAVLAEKVSSNRRDFEHADNLLSGVDARQDKAIKKLYVAVHRIELRQVEMGGSRVRDRYPVPPMPSPEPNDHE